ncbi:MAG: hypothetical protein AAB922_03165 [Patescibacteria group bacterium]
MRIAYIGNFNVLSVGEPEIAKCLEELGHTVVRYPEGCELKTVDTNVDFVLFAKMRCGNLKEREDFLQSLQVPSVCWLFDLYAGMTSESGL